MPTFLSSLLTNTGLQSASPLSAALANWGMDMGGGQGAGQFPSAPPAGGYQMPQASSLNLLSPEIAMPIAAALMGGRGNAESLAGGMAALGEGMGKIRSRNQLNGLMKDYPELAPFLDAGADPADVLKVVMKKQGLDGSEETFSSPQIVTNPDGTQSIYGLGNHGGTKKYDLGGASPYTKPQWRNMGDHYGLLDPVTHEELAQKPIENYQKAYDTSSGTAAGKSQGEAQALYQSMTAKMPGLQQVVKKLDSLANDATYTFGGQALDATRRQLGLPPRDSAKARAEYIATVSNQILPLLRDTFGAQFTAREGDTLMATLGDPDKAPAEKQAVLKAFIEQKQRDIEALAQQTGQEPPAMPQPDTGSTNPAPRLRYNPDTGELE